MRVTRSIPSPPAPPVPAKIHFVKRSGAFNNNCCSTNPPSEKPTTRIAVNSNVQTKARTSSAIASIVSRAWPVDWAHSLII